MKLRSDFHDYYDHVLGYGIDDTVHYNRFTKKVDIRVKTSLSWPTQFFVGIVGFCGRVYPFAEVLRHEQIVTDNTTEYRVVETYYAYSPEEYKSKASEWRDRGGWFNCSDNFRWAKLKQFFRDWNFESDEIFLEHDVPVWVLPRICQNGSGLTNPRLKNLGFERVKGPVAAFQEISVYVANILGGQKTRVDIEDKSKVERHGFDPKHSFRKEKKP